MYWSPRCLSRFFRGHVCVCVCVCVCTYVRSFDRWSRMYFSLEALDRHAGFHTTATKTIINKLYLDYRTIFSFILHNILLLSLPLLRDWYYIIFVIIIIIIVIYANIHCQLKPRLFKHKLSYD